MRSSLEASWSLSFLAWLGAAACCCGSSEARAGKMATSALEKLGLADASGERKPMARGTSASANSSKLELMATMASEFGMCPVGPGPSPLFYDALTPKNRCLFGSGWGWSGDGDLHAGTVDFHGQQTAPGIG